MTLKYQETCSKRIPSLSDIITKKRFPSLIKINSNFYLKIQKVTSSQLIEPAHSTSSHHHHHPFNTCTRKMVNTRQDPPFPFPQTQSKVLADPSKFFSSNLLSSPLPTNSFFQNFVLNNGDQPECIHPSLINSSSSSISVSYPSRVFTSAFICQLFKPDLTLSSSRITHNNSHGKKHVISSYSDLSVTLEIPSSNMSFFLVRGSPYVTVSLSHLTPLSITTTHEIRLFSSNDSLTKHTVLLNNAKTWFSFASSPVKLNHSLFKITSGEFSGIVRIAMLPDSSSENEAILDKFSIC